MQILETERLVVRELDSAIDAEFIFELLNTPKFIHYIGDRGVRTASEAADFIENRYRQSYRDHGFGLYLVESKVDVRSIDGTLATARVSASNTPTQIGICGFVRRDTLPEPDIGFAFLPEFEGKGYGFESATAMLRYGRDTLSFERVLAITSQDNDVSGKLLTKLCFSFNGNFTTPEGEELKLYEIQL